MAMHSLADQAAPELLIYGAVRNHVDLAAAWAPGKRHGRALVALLGRTRAAVLEAIGDGCTTTELADRVKVSVSSASQHAAVLCNAGLIVTRRVGKSVRHSLTPLGAALIDSA
jgi:DNA-binding transcriptional ArsR family regulator